MGGGFISLGANAIELSEICKPPDSECEIKQSYANITNSAPLSTKQISIQTQITDFINYSTIKAQKIEVKGGDNKNHFITNFYNYGRIETTDKEGSLLTDTISTRGFHNIYNYGYISSNVFFAQSETENTHIVNYGTMGGIGQNVQSTKPITIDNYGEINLFQVNGSGKKYHFSNVHITLQNYAMKINERADKFNSFDGNATDNSHLILGITTRVKFADKNSKMILDFGDNFEFGTGYLFNKLVVNTDGTSQLSVDLSHLTTKNDIFYITKQGDKFIVHLAPQYSAIGNLYKANVRTMNNFMTMSNAMIYPRKHHKSQNLGRKNYKNISSLRDLPTANRGNPKDLRAKRSNHPPYENNVDSALPLKSYESFAYQDESQNLQTRRIQRNKRNYSRSQRNNNSVILSDSEESKKKQNRDSSHYRDQNDNKRFSQNLNKSAESKPYYFILTPFINHNLFFESGRYNLSGFDYGFLTAFSARVAESNSLGAHFAFSYGSLNDKHDKDLNIRTMNFMLGLNYKLDLIWNMYLKARGDVFYFLNALDSATLKNIKPNNLGFGVSVSYGKDFDFKQGGVLGIEAGLDYKALQSNNVELHDNTYQKQLYNLLYVDLGLTYAKYFGNFGFNANLGIKGNITANKLAKSKISLNNFNKSVDMVLDNDKVLGYTNLALSYVLNHKNFDMEFSLAYYGNFGDRIMSNGGGFEWRVIF